MRESDLSEFVRTLELSMLDFLSPENVSQCVTCVRGVLQDYTITKNSKDLIVYDDANEKLLKEFAACLIVQGRAEGTIRQSISTLRSLYEYTGKDLVKCTSNNIRSYLAQQLLNGIKKASLNNHRNRISAFYKWAYSEQIVDKNPCEFIGSIKCEKEVKLPFSDIEVDKMRNSITNLRDRAIFEVLISSGVRVNELVNLNRGDIDKESLRVFVKQGKGSKDRITYISRVAYHHLEEYLKTRTDNDDAMFLNYTNREEKYRNRITDSGVSAIMRRLGKELGIPKVHPHRFRRTFATTMYKRGMNIVDIQHLLGHDDVSTTMAYIYCDNDNLKIQHMKYSA